MFFCGKTFKVTTEKEAKNNKPKTIAMIGIWQTPQDLQTFQTQLVFPKGKTPMSEYKFIHFSEERNEQKKEI